MAAGTLQRWLGLASGRDMALRAKQLCMRTLQRETRHHIVIEAGLLPAGAAVAAGAVHSVGAFMGVIDGVTAKAGGRRLGDLGRLFVTCRTGGLVMCPLQRETRHPVMIEAGLLPVPGRMAAGAIGAVLTLVDVILAVAGETIPRGFADAIVWPVAARASGRGVLANQREVCVAIVIEGRCPP